jgi:uncharacterized protein (TIGR02996 family)
VSDEAAFLAALKANPADDLTRLVYADWLDEHAEPQKAEYLRLVAEFARGANLADEPGDRIGALALELPVEWRLDAAARFGLIVEIHDHREKVEAIKLVRELMGRGLGPAKAFVESAPPKPIVRTTAECAIGLHSHHYFFRLPREPGHAIAELTTRFATFTAIASLYPIPGNYYDDEGEDFSPPPDALTMFETFLAAALGVPASEAVALAQHSRGSVVLAHGVEFAALERRLRDWNAILPQPDPARDWDISINRHCTFVPVPPVPG